MMQDKEFEELCDKIVKGAALAYERLVAQKKKEDGELIFGIDGKIVRVKVRDLPENGATRKAQPK
ncbi:MAG: hypothetical protein LBG47_07045 [Prevotellaceae bacterium]|nr:hypothetical protein [Prevotellaceae bacterium]